MIIADTAVTLIRRDTRENDRIISVYTQSHGRVNIRFPGVNKPRGKLKAFAEPFVLSELRVHLRGAQSVGCAAGGKLVTVFPLIRADFAKTQTALHFCELLFRMTPEFQPNPQKFSLIKEALYALEGGPLSPVLACAYMLRLMEKAGVGLDRPVAGISEAFWLKLTQEPLEFALLAPGEEDDLRRTGFVISRFISSYFDRPLKTAPVFGMPDGRALGYTF